VRAKGCIFSFPFHQSQGKEGYSGGVEDVHKLESRFMNQFLAIAKARRPTTYDRFWCEYIEENINRV
jgi:hypothetical protein